MSAYIDGAGKQIHIGAELGHGGGGTVFVDPADQSSVIKLLKKPTAENGARLRAMVELRIPTQVPGIGGDASLAWPTRLVLDQRGGVRGYVMPAAVGPSPAKLYKLMQRQERERIARNLSWRTLIRIACHCADVVNHLHSNRIIFGDINESNFMAGGRGAVTAIDCDAMQFTDRSGKLWYTGYHKPEYLAPELRGVDLKTSPRREEHDRFALAILIFQLLMDNFHPFSAVAASGSSDSVDQFDQARTGQFAFGNRAKGFQPPPGAPPWRTIPPELQQLFQRAFTAGSDHPDRRPPASEYGQVLRQVERHLRRCSGRRQHEYPASAGLCPWCEYERRLTQPTRRRRPATAPQPPPRPVGPPPVPGPYGAPPVPPPGPVVTAPPARPPVPPPSSALRRHPVAAVVVVLIAIVVIATASSDSGPESSSGSEASSGSGDTSGSSGSSGGTGDSGEDGSRPRIDAPSRVLKLHFQRLSEGDPQSAWRLFVPGYRAEAPGWIRQVEAAEPRINMTKVGPAEISGDEAWVPVKFYARDTNDTPRSDTDCRRFKGDAHMVRVGGKWRYDPMNNDVVSHRLHTPVSSCP